MNLIQVNLKYVSTTLTLRREERRRTKNFTRSMKFSLWKCLYSQWYYQHRTQQGSQRYWWFLSNFWFVYIHRYMYVSCLNDRQWNHDQIIFTIKLKDSISIWQTCFSFILNLTLESISLLYRKVKLSTKEVSFIVYRLFCLIGKKILLRIYIY